jgi:putative serine protease PepD
MSQHRAGGDGDDPFRRPDGVDAPFAAPNRPAPAPAARAVPPSVPTPETEQAFGRPDAGTGAFARPPGPADAGRGESPWWVPGADRDPWRDPASAPYLGAPVVFEDPPPPPADDIPAAGPGVRRRWRPRRPSVGGAALVVIIALLLAGVGGATGFVLADHYGTSSLLDPGAKLATVGPSIQRRPGSVADIARRVLPSVVSIQVRTADEEGTGSGVVIDAKGYILTNNHVVSLAATSAGTIRVIYNDQSSSSARIVGRDPKTDLAVIKVDKPGLVVARLGDSSKIVVGDPVIAIGSPLGLAGTVTSGIVSALDRPVRLSGEGSDTNAVIDAIQTDAAINPGNSGGALVDATGATVGINSAIASLGSQGQSGSIGVGFAIPINAARRIALQLIHSGHVVHATLGLNARSVTDLGRRGGDGAQVEVVDRGGAAQKAGIREGDVITAIDGKPVSSSEELIVLVGSHRVGDTVTLTIDRGGSPKTVRATLQRD